MITGTALYSDALKPASCTGHQTHSQVSQLVEEINFPEPS